MGKNKIMVYAESMVDGLATAQHERRIFRVGMKYIPHYRATRAKNPSRGNEGLNLLLRRDKREAKSETFKIYIDDIII